MKLNFIFWIGLYASMVVFSLIKKDNFEMLAIRFMITTILGAIVYFTWNYFIK